MTDVLLDYGKCDSLSTVPELGAEKDLEDPESELSELIPLEEQAHPKRNTDPPPQDRKRSHLNRSHQRSPTDGRKRRRGVPTRTFFYNAEILVEQRYPIIKGDLLKEANSKHPN